jgi:hypothetical protein
LISMVLLRSKPESEGSYPIFKMVFQILARFLIILGQKAAKWKLT